MQQKTFNIVVIVVLAFLVVGFVWLINWNMKFQDAVYQMKLNYDDEFYSVEYNLYQCCTGGTPYFGDTNESTLQTEQS